MQLMLHLSIKCIVRHILGAYSDDETRLCVALFLLLFIIVVVLGI